MIEKIQKRNGQMVAFDSVKILNAISRANMAVEDEVMDPADLSYLTQKVCSQLNPDEVVTVEHVQDVVEETLIRFDYAKTAKAYILYLLCLNQQLARRHKGRAHLISVEHLREQSPHGVDARTVDAPDLIDVDLCGVI